MTTARPSASADLASLAQPAADNLAGKVITPEGGRDLVVWSLILLVAAAVIVAAICGVIALVVYLSKSKPANPYGVPPAQISAAPGWYPDPNNPAWMRYFDGQVWTSSTQPRG